MGQTDRILVTVYFLLTFNQASILKIYSVRVECSKLTIETLEQGVKYVQS